METANIKLTGVLIGSDQNGYTSFFRELPFVSAEGKTVKEAQMNLFETIQFAFEYLQEENPGDQRGENCQEFSAILTLA
jgi:predicted RNase H-like HicB family nuclease